MRTSADAHKLIHHAYARLTTRLLREGALVDPAEVASVFLRHFDVKLVQEGECGPNDGRVDGRTLWVSPALVAGWLGRHQAARERRVNGWMRLTEAAQAFLIQLAVTALRGQALETTDLFGLSQAVSTTPVGQRLQVEMQRLYRIQVSTPPAFYSMGEPGAVLTTLRSLGQPLPESWRLLLEPAWEALGWGGTMDSRTLPDVLPSGDATVGERARWIAYSLAPPALPPMARVEGDPTTLAEGFVTALQPLLNTTPLPPPFLFENLAHGYRHALETHPEHPALKPVVDSKGRLNASIRFGCVMAAIDALAERGADTEAYEPALMAGLCNLERQD